MGVKEWDDPKRLETTRRFVIMCRRRSCETRAGANNRLFFLCPGAYQCPLLGHVEERGGPLIEQRRFIYHSRN